MIILPMLACSLAHDIVAVATFLADFTPVLVSSLIIITDNLLKSAVTSVLDLSVSEFDKPANIDWFTAKVFDAEGRRIPDGLDLGTVLFKKLTISTTVS
jgi:hypothetical protein